MCAESLQLCLTLCNPMDYSPPGSSIHRILQPRILEWVAIPFYRRLNQPRDWADPGIEPRFRGLQAVSLPSELAGKPGQKSKLTYRHAELGAVKVKNKGMFRPAHCSFYLLCSQERKESISFLFFSSPLQQRDIKKPVFATTSQAEWSLEGSFWSA